VEPRFLATLTDAERAALVTQGRRRRLPRGAILITEGARSDAVYVVLSGHVKVYSTTERGGEVVLAVRGPGALVGELAAIDDEPRAASVCALEPIEVLAVPAEAFRQFLSANPGVMLTLMRMLTGRLRDADRKRVEFGAHDTLGRVAARLVELAERYGEPVGEGVRITLPLSQEELAGWTGSSREAVGKALHALRGLGWVRTERRRITVLEIEPLRRRSM